MTDMTLLGDRYFLAIKALKNRLHACAAWFKPAPKTLHVGRINDHLARDIGLSQAEIARHRLTLPSQTHHHPRG
ncbi:hypothetical protein [Roseobacter sp.]|uniref:hypothetical protein n=1 Tax=Roseobacter sp. TaxID=1907202 RepID=UPI00385D7F86